MLPKKVIDEIEQLMRIFLWSGIDLKETGAKVAWKDVCCPREEGGWGFKCLNIRNLASMAKHLWNLISPSPISLWSKWAKENLFKRINYWVVQCPGDCS